MLTNDAEALERGFRLFGGSAYNPGNDIASGLENHDNDIASGLENAKCIICGKESNGVMCEACGDEIFKQVAHNDYEPAGPATLLEVPPRMRNVAPPGMEHVVKALKKEPGITNPFAVAWAMYEKKNAMANDDDPISVGAVRG